MAAVKDRKLGDVPLRDLSTAYGTFFDKAQLIKGKATNRTEVEHGVSPEVQELMDKILGREPPTALPQAKIIGEIEPTEEVSEEVDVNHEEMDAGCEEAVG